MSFKRIHIHLTALSIIILYAAGTNSYSQNISYREKTQILNNQRQQQEDSVRKLTETEDAFIIGRLHTPNANDVNHPYYKENKWVKGSLVYNAISYPVNNIKYDIENDKLVYLKYSQDYSMISIALDEHFIPQFSFSNTAFRYFTGLKNRSGIRLKDGYYEVVYDGKLKFLIRWEKAQVFDENAASMKYKTSTDMFLLKNGKMIRVRSLAKLKRQLKDQKKLIRRFTRSNYLRLNESDYSSAAKVLNYYESLRK